MLAGFKFVNAAYRRSITNKCFSICTTMYIRNIDCLKIENVAMVANSALLENNAGCCKLHDIKKNLTEFPSNIAMYINVSR